MGYAHDIFLDLDYDRAAFAAAVADVRALFRRSELPVVGPSGRPGTMPVLDNDFIGFNGVNQNCVCDPGEPDYHGLEECLNDSCWSSHRGDGSYQPFVIDLKPGRLYGPSELRGSLWFDCKTRRKLYDQAVMLAMIALKHHLGVQVEMHSKGRWNIEWGHGGGPWDRWVGRKLPGPIDIYEHVFPDRVPVANILSSEGEGW